MTWAEFNTEVSNFLDVDARRRGIEAFRTAYIKAALADLQNYVPDLKGEFRSYVDADETPYDSEVAEAVAEYLKSKITRNVDRDLALSQAHGASYGMLRRRLFIRSQEARSMELRPFAGKLFTIVLDLRLERLPLPVVILGNIWFTVRRHPLDCAFVLQVQRGTGIEVLDAAASKIRLTLTAAQTALLTGAESFWDLQVETANQNPVFPLRGKINPQIPITREFGGEYLAPAPVVLEAFMPSFHESANVAGVTTIAAPTQSVAHTELTTVTGGATGRIFVLEPVTVAWASTSPGCSLRHRVIMPAVAGILLEWRDGATDGTLLTSFLSSDSGDDVVADFVYDGAAYRFVSFLAPANA